MHIDDAGSAFCSETYWVRVTLPRAPAMRVMLLFMALLANLSACRLYRDGGRVPAIVKQAALVKLRNMCTIQSCNTACSWTSL